MSDILAFENVSVSHRGRRGTITPILSDISFAIPAGGAFGLVGESGCGKSTAALAAMHYLAPGIEITHGRILLDGQDLARFGSRELTKMRGNTVAMVYQDPMSSLNPVMTIGDQLMEVPLLHGLSDKLQARERARAMLAEVRMADAGSIMSRYPHELSGGQQQRVVIAMALMAEPKLLIMDEPTTGLDVTIEAAILDLVRDLRHRFGTAILFISHNLGTVARICDDIGVLYAGRLVETGPIRDVFRSPAHPYTRGLFGALPGNGAARHRLTPIDGIITAADRLRPGCAFGARCAHHVPARCDVAPIGLTVIVSAIVPQKPNPTIQATPSPVAPPRRGEARGARGGRESHGQHSARCVRLGEFSVPPTQSTTERADTAGHDPALAVRNVSKIYRSRGLFGGTRGAPVRAATDVSFDARPGTTLAIVGESGCGKSTIARVIAGLVDGTSGEAMLDGVNLATTAVDARPIALRRRVQMVFQNPDATLNPAHTVGYALRRPLRRLKGLSRAATEEELTKLLARVRLPPDVLTRRPHQLSGGQRQRVAIARALAGEPDILIADEPVSALDVSVQAAVVNLLGDLVEGSQLSLLLISHDLALVRHMADWIAVMYLGRVVEYGPAAHVLAPPFHPYTEALLAAAPRPDPDATSPAIVLTGQMPSASAEITGCAFASRCPRKLGPLCDTTPPPIRTHGAHTIACHIEAMP